MTASPQYRLPNLLIVGAQKSGTTWLHSALSKSAHVFGSSPKEIGFFNKKMFFDGPELYQTYFPVTDGARYYMESTPHYFRLPGNKVDLAGRIQATLGDVRLIVTLRNPVDRYISAYIHHIMKDRLAPVDEITEMNENFRMLELGRYGEILAHWQGVFSDIGVFFYDDLKNDDMSYFRSVMSFLDLPCDVSARDLDFTTNDKMKKLHRSSIDTLPEASLDLRRRLGDYYAADIALLEQLTGRDLAHWTE